MNPERWKQIDQILQQVLSQPPANREPFLDQACAGDEDLRREVESLIEHDQQAGSFINSPAPGAITQEHPEKSHADFVGRTLLHYRIVEKIGEGGMGMVYRAEDSHLKRSVAIKLLPPASMTDPERKKRFIHEARAASALNHPNIITIHDISSADGIDFIAMEYVSGKPLAQLIGDKGLPLREALKYSVQIADALEKAHRAGIVHRDLKPSNIMVTGDGLVKVLDFGLAKLTQAADDADLTKSAESMTQSGAIVGTAAYMSPEQAEGKAVDARSDIFSFGAMLYEMVTGRRAFKGDSSISTLSAILHEEPEPVSRIAEGIPQELERVITRCLKKAPERRFQHMDDVKVALEELREEPVKRRGAKAAYWIAAVLAALIGIGIWVFVRLFSGGTTLPEPRIVPVTSYRGYETLPALSPDGNWIAFAWDSENGANFDIYVKEVGGAGSSRLTTDPANDLFPTWSPDGRQIAFIRVTGERNALYVVSALGGGEQKLTEYRGAYPFGGGLSWSADGKSIAISGKESPTGPFCIWSFTVATRAKEKLTSPPPGFTIGDALPAYSPDGRYLSFLRTPEPPSSGLYVMRLPRGDARLVTDYDRPQSACWTADSREIVYSSSSFTGESALWRISKEGGQPRRVSARGPACHWPSIHGHRLAYAAVTGSNDLFRLELTGDKSVKLPSGPLFPWTTYEESPHISPDASRIVFISDRSGSAEVWVCNSDGSGPQQLTDMRAGSTGSPRWSPDGKLIAFDSLKSGNSHIYVIAAAGGQPQRLTTEPTEEYMPRWSRDGRWIYFGSKRSGSMQIWRMPAEGGRAIQITRHGGLAAVESADGYLYYSDQINQKKGVWRVPVSGGQETLVMDAVRFWGNWDLTDRGIYFIDPDKVPATLAFFEFATRSVVDLTAFIPDDMQFAAQYVCVSPNGRWLVYSGGINASDIMLIDNFR
jgi:Tol biopolymer transport system component/predicted Ser/Thr protein kinase